MVLKNSEEYDSILHVGADIEFIDRVFVVNYGDLDKAKIQLFEQYGKEYESNLQNSATNREKSLASVLNSRNLALIERSYSDFRLKQIVRLNAGAVTLSIQDTLDRAELNCIIAEKNLEIEKRTLSLLRVASNVEDVMIWGTEKNIFEYQQEFERRNVKTDDGKNPTIEQLEINLELAQSQLNSAYDYAKTQAVNSQDNLGGSTKK